MPKVPLRGFLVDVGDITYVGQNNTPKQVILLNIPGWTNTFGEKIGQDEIWQITILGKKVDDFNIHRRHVNSKVNIEVFINSNQYTNPDGKVMYIVNVNLASIQFVGGASQHAASAGAQPVTMPSYGPPADLNSRPGDDDDLPF